MPANFETLMLWQYLRGQVIVHSLKGKSKDEMDSLIVLKFDAIEFLFHIFQIPIIRRKNIFRKLFLLCELLYNKEEQSTTENTKEQFGGFMRQLTQKPKTVKR